MRALLPVCLLFALALSGCLGGDSPEADGGENGNGGEIVEDAGHVSGDIRDQSLEPVNDARIRLVTDSEVAYERFTNSTGVFNMTIVTPGTYKLQVFAPHCCETKVVRISVGPNEHVEKNLLLDPKIPDDGEPYVSNLMEAGGLISCAVNTPTQPFYLCSTYDENHDTDAGNIVDDTSPGLKTVTVALVWEGDFPLRLNVYINVDGSQLIATTDGTSPLEIPVHNSEIEDEDLKFEAFYGQSMPLRFEAEPVDPGVMYQEKLDFYWTYHFWEEAPNGFSTIPDV